MTDFKSLQAAVTTCATLQGRS